MSIRPVALVLLAGLALCARSDGAAPYVPWIDRAAARPWLPALDDAARRTGLPPALIAELVGIESGFQTVRNPKSSAFGCGQQTNGNPYIARYRLDRAKCADSILAAALQFGDALTRTGSIAGAARAYGTTAHLPAARRAQILARLEAASRLVATQMVAQQIAPIGHGTVPAATPEKAHILTSK